MTAVLPSQPRFNSLRRRLYRWRNGRAVWILIERSYCEKHGYWHWAM